MILLIGTMCTGLKKCSKEDKLSKLGGVLKAYQSNIDFMTRRTKYAEKSFLSLYKALQEVQDPVAIIQDRYRRYCRRVWGWGWGWGCVGIRVAVPARIHSHFSECTST